MKRFLVFILFAILPARIFAQQTIVAVLDTAFASGGKVEFGLSDFGDEATDLYGVFPDMKSTSVITVCGKVGTSDPLVKKFGLVRLKANGTFDPSFGVAGKMIRTWAVSDYPNKMFVIASDSSMIFAGASNSSGLENDELPSLYSLNKSGIPDSSFGGDGHVALRYDATSHGSFNNLYQESGNFLGTGSLISNNSNGPSGFCAMRVKPDGTFDSTFGIFGKSLISLRVHSVTGYLTQNASITFIGVVDTNGQSVVFLGRMTAKGSIDSTFGNVGILNTEISLTAGTTLISGVQPDYKIVAALPMQGPSQTKPFTLIRFKTDGSPDSTYGTAGYVVVPVAPEAEPKGITIANNGKTVVTGDALGNLTKTAISRSNVDGSPDISFNMTGMVVLDIDTNTYSNYLSKLVGIGLKRYIGIGGSVHNGKNQFLIVRLKDDTLQTGSVIAEKNHPSLIYPNPVVSNCTVSSDYVIDNITILDELGRNATAADIARTNEYTFSVDMGRLLPGVYYYIVRQGSGKSTGKIVVTH